MVSKRNTAVRYYVEFSPSTALKEQLGAFLQNPDDVPGIETTTYATMSATGDVALEHAVFAEGIDTRLERELSSRAIGLSGIVSLSPIPQEAAYRFYLPVYKRHQAELDDISDAMRSIPGYEAVSRPTKLYWQVAKHSLVRGKQLVEAQGGLVEALRDPNAYRRMRAINPRLMQERLS